MRRQTSRQPYQRPLIQPQPFEGPRKQPTGQSAGSRLVAIEDTLDGVGVHALRAEFGSPLYVVSEATLRRKYRTFVEAFRTRYPDTVVAYSYKTNYVSGICALLHQAGAWAEVVSGFELDLARSLGVPGHQIVYNGPYKPYEHLRTAAKLGALINADSLEELGDLEEIAREFKRPLGIGIRVNMRVNDPPWTKFGFNLESGEAQEVCRKVAASSGLRLIGLHLHAGTYLSRAETYGRAVAALVNLALLLESRHKATIEYLDLGAGYATSNTLHGQLLPGALMVPPPDVYAEAICSPLKAALRRFRPRPRLILEPGRALVDEAVSLLVSVVSVKTMADGRRGVIVDGGINLLPSAYYFCHEIAAVREGDGEDEEADIYGPLCMQIDVLRQAVVLPPLQRGGILVFKHAGAYTISNSMQFIYPRPPIVMVTDGRTHLLRRAEAGADLLRLDEIPAHLAPGLGRGAGPGRRDGHPAR